MTTSFRIRGLKRGLSSPLGITGCIGWFDATQMRPASVQPDSLSGIAAWFKADALSLSNGDPISTWSDSSAGGHTLTAATTARPTYTTNVLNGNPVARFNGSSNGMDGDSGLAQVFSGVVGCTVFYVCSTNVQTTIQYVASWVASGGTGGYIIQYGIDDASARFYHIGRRLAADTIAETVGPTTANGQYRAYCGTDAPAATAGIKSYYDDAHWATSNHFSNGVFGTATGGTFALGSSPSAAGFWLNGDVAELIVYTRVLTVLERYQVGRYLSDKYATAAIPSTDADLVTDWLDLSGNLTHLFQSGTQRPLYKTNIQNSKPVVRFDGSNDLIKSAAISTINEPFTVVIVGKRSATATADTFFDGIVTGAYIRGTTTPTYRIFGGTAAGTSDTSWHVMTATANGSSDVLYVDGTAVIGPSTQGTVSLTGFNLGSDAGGGNPHAGDIAEVIVYNSALSTADRQALERLLGTKWGITVA